MDEWFFIKITDLMGRPVRNVVVQGRAQVGEVIAKELPIVSAFDREGMREFLERGPRCRFPGSHEYMDVHSLGLRGKARIWCLSEPPRYSK